MINEKLKEYAERFGDNFPVMCFEGVADEEIVKLINKALDDNEPYVMEYESNVIY